MKTKNKIIPFKIIFATLIIISIFSTAGISITLIGEYEDSQLIGTETYTARIPTREDQSAILEDPIKLNNKFEANLIPKISTEDQEFTLTPPGTQTLMIREEEEYEFEFTGEVSQLITTQKINFREGQIDLEVEIQNNRDFTTQVTTSYEVTGPPNTKIFYPYAVDNQTWNYVVLTNENHKGNSLAVATNTYFTGHEPFQERRTQHVRKGRELEPGETKTFEITLRPMNIWTEENQLGYPHQYSTFLENTLVETQGTIEKDITSGETPQKTDEILSKIQTTKQTTGDGSFTNFNTVNLEQEEINSLEASVMFKELCIQEEIPCRIVIGQTGNGKFAWIETLENQEWISIDPFEGTKSHPDHRELYKEPKLPYIEVEGEEAEGEPYLEATKAGLQRDILNPLFYLIPILALTVTVITILYFKSEDLIERLTPEEIEKEPELNGEYEIMVEKEEVKEKTAVPMFEKVKKENGEVNIEKYAEETKYSENLVENYISYLKNQGYIRPKKQEQEEEQEE